MIDRGDNQAAMAHFLEKDLQGICVSVPAGIEGKISLALQKNRLDNFLAVQTAPLVHYLVYVMLLLFWSLPRQQESQVGLYWMDNVKIVFQEYSGMVKPQYLQSHHQ